MLCFISLVVSVVEMRELTFSLLLYYLALFAGEKLERIGFEWEVPVGQQQSDVATAQVRV